MADIYKKLTKPPADLKIAAGGFYIQIFVNLLPAYI
jgi:hypothetical protein